MKVNHPVQCNLCGYGFDRDPVYEVPCPHCGAKIGQACRRPSEHVPSGAGFWRGWHTERDLLAARCGAYHHECSRLCPASCGHPAHATLGERADRAARQRRAS